MKLLRELKRIVTKNKSRQKTTIQLLKEIREGVANHADLTNKKMNECIGLTRQLVALQQLHLEFAVKLQEQGSLSARELSRFQGSPIQLSEESQNEIPDSKTAIAHLPLLLAEKTYNTGHPSYEANKVRNFPGRFFNSEIPSNNEVLKELYLISDKKKRYEIKDETWNKILETTLSEIKTIEHSSQTFERIDYIESYTQELSKRHQAHYMAGWVNIPDALFLYWLVRKLKPKTIVQTGVCNGLSTAFMVLGLVKNGPEGMLHAIDLPYIFDPKDPAWTVKNQVYGVLIPEGKCSGWLVPDAYRDRVTVQCGDAKQLLPPLIDSLDNIDMFYHDSDHTYNHMMFEFNEAHKKLSKGGLIVADDISWNESVWDFADTHRVPSYNYKGAVGVAFF